MPKNTKITWRKTTKYFESLPDNFYYYSMVHCHILQIQSVHKLPGYSIFWNDTPKSKYNQVK